jgi:hypothetical protein
MVCSGTTPPFPETFLFPSYPSNCPVKRFSLRLLSRPW